MPPKQAPRRSARIAAITQAKHDTSTAAVTHVKDTDGAPKDPPEGGATVAEGLNFISKLPLEVLIQIAGYLDTYRRKSMGMVPAKYGRLKWKLRNIRKMTDVLHFSMVSKRMNEASQPALYKTIHILSPRKLLLLFRALEFRSDRYNLIQNLFLTTRICDHAECANISIDCDGRCKYLHDEQHQMARTTEAVIKILSRSINTRKLLLSLQMCSVYDFEYRQTNDDSSVPVFLAQLHAPAASSDGLLPRLDQLNILELPWDHLSIMEDLLSHPSLKRLDCINNFGGRWRQLRMRAPGNHYPNIASLDVANAFPTDPSDICDLFPSLIRLKICIDQRNFRQGESMHVRTSTSTEFLEKSLSVVLPKLKVIEELTLKIHWGYLPWLTDLPVNTLGPSRRLNTLVDLTNLTTLEIGMHLIMACPPGGTFKTLRWLETDEYLSPASVLPPRIRHLTLYHCRWCSGLFRGAYQFISGVVRWDSRFPKPDKFVAFSFIQDLAVSKADGVFPHLEDVRFLANSNLWHQKRYRVLPDQGERVGRDGTVWTPGWFVESFDALKSHGVDFSAKEVLFIECDDRSKCDPDEISL